MRASEDLTPTSMRCVFFTVHRPSSDSHRIATQIFDIGDYYENSALDMEDAEQTAPAEMLQRRRSSAVGRSWIAARIG